jgi:hypothetical protein
MAGASKEAANSDAACRKRAPARRLDIEWRRYRYFRENTLSKLDAYVAAVELAIKTMDAVFMRLNAAEVITPLIPPAQRWALPPAQREAAERAEIANYDVAPDQWGARLCLMAAWESLHAARRAASLRAPVIEPPVAAWRNAAAGAVEAARLAQCAATEFSRMVQR